MPTQDTTETKNKIVSLLESKGPLLPVHIGRGTGLGSLFISAFLSELVSAGKIKVSHMKVGNSPLYYLKGQEGQLEKFSEYLKSKEKEAYEILKDKRALKDSEQEPAISVALEAIKDFAIPFQKDGEKYWRYMLLSEDEAVKTISTNEDRSSETDKAEHQEEPKTEYEGQKHKEPLPDNPEETVQEKPEKTPRETSPEEKSSPDPKFESPLKEDKGRKDTKRTPTKTSKSNKKSSSSSKKSSKFFDKVKSHLAEQSIEIADIIGFSKDDLILKIVESGEEKILIAYNKNKLNEDDIIKAYKNASEFDMKYTVLSKGGALKKLESLLEALEKFDSIKSMK